MAKTLYKSTELRFLEPGIAFSYTKKKEQVSLTVELDSVLHPYAGKRSFGCYDDEAKLSFDVRQEKLWEYALEWQRLVEKYCA